MVLVAMHESYNTVGVAKLGHSMSGEPAPVENLIELSPFDGESWAMETSSWHCPQVVHNSVTSCPPWGITILGLLPILRLGLQSLKPQFLSLSLLPFLLLGVTILPAQVRDGGTNFDRSHLLSSLLSINPENPYINTV